MNLRFHAWLCAAAAVAIVIVTLATRVHAACPSGSTGDSCRTACALACSGYEECNIDACGNPQCICNGHGELDTDTNLCRCEVSWAGEFCERALTTTDCRQSQVRAIELPVPSFSVCNTTSGVATCVNGALPYSATATTTMGVFGDALEDCNKPRIVGMTLRTLVSSTPYILHRGNQSDFVGRVQTDTPRADAFRFAFERVFTTPTVYKIQSAFDRTRTLEILNVNGVRSVGLSTRYLGQPSLWKTVNPLQIGGVLFTIESYNQPGLYLSLSATRQLVLSSTVISQWLLDEDKVTTIRYPGASLSNYSFVSNPTNWVQNGISYPVSMIDPLACLYHCQRESQCSLAIAGFGDCYLIRNPPVFTVNGADLTPIRYRMYSIRPTSESPDGRCLTTAINLPACTKRAIGPINLQDSASGLTLAVNPVSLDVSWTSRTGSVLMGYRYWMLENMDTGNEYVVYPQGMRDTYVLGVDSNFQPVIVERDALSPVTWFIEEDLTEPGHNISSTAGYPFKLRLASQPGRVLGGAYILNGVIVSPGTGVLSVITRPDSEFSKFYVGRLRVSHYDTNPRVYVGQVYVFSSSDLRTYQPQFIYCVSACMQEKLCRVVQWSPSVKTCFLDTTPTGIVSSTTLAGAADTLVHYISNAEDPLWFGTSAPCSPARGSRPSGSEGVELYGTPFARMYNSQTCPPPQYGPVTMRSKRFQSYEIQDANGRFVSYAQLYSQGTTLVSIAYQGQPFRATPFDYNTRSQRFMLRASGDGPGIYYLHSATNPQLTLEVDYTRYPESAYVAQRFVVMNYTYPDRQSRWRLVGFSANTAGSHRLESYEHPGYVLEVSQSFAAQELVTVASVTGTDLWSMVVMGETNFDSDTAYVHGGTYYDASGVRTSTASEFTCPDLYGCVGHAMRYSEISLFSFDYSTLLCRVYVQRTVARVLTTIGFTTSITGAAGIQIAAARQSYQGLVGTEDVTQKLCSARTPQPNFYGPCTITTCALQNYLSSRNDGCASSVVIHRLRLSIYTSVGVLVGTLLNSHLSLTKYGLSAYRICVDSSNDARIKPTGGSCVHYDISTNTISLETARITTFNVPDGAGFSTQYQNSQSKFLLRLNSDTPTGEALYLKYSSVATNGLFAQVVPLVEGVQEFLWSLEFRETYNRDHYSLDVKTLVTDPTYDYFYISEIVIGAQYGPSYVYIRPAPSPLSRPFARFVVDTVFTSSELECKGRALEDLRVMGYVMDGSIAGYPICTLYSQFDITEVRVPSDLSGGSEIINITTQFIAPTISAWIKTPSYAPLTQLQMQQKDRAGGGTGGFTLTGYLSADGSTMQAGGAGRLILVQRASLCTAGAPLPGGTPTRVINGNGATAALWSLLQPNQRISSATQVSIPAPNIISTTVSQTGGGGSVYNIPRGVYALTNGDYIASFQPGSGCEDNVVFLPSTTTIEDTPQTILFDIIYVTLDTFVARVSPYKWQDHRYMRAADTNDPAVGRYLCLLEPTVISFFSGDLVNPIPSHVKPYLQTLSAFSLSDVPDACFLRLA